MFSPSFPVEARLLPSQCRFPVGLVYICHLCLMTHWAFRVFVIGRIIFEIKVYASSELRNVFSLVKFLSIYPGGKVLGGTQSWNI